jgi:hypothetical protein
MVDSFIIITSKEGMVALVPRHGIGREPNLAFQSERGFWEKWSKGRVVRRMEQRIGVAIRCKGAFVKPGMAYQDR